MVLECSHIHPLLWPPSLATSLPHRVLSAGSMCLHWLPVSAPSTYLDEYFFKSLVVGLSYSFSGSSGCFFVLRLVVLLLGGSVRCGEACLPTPPSWQEVSIFSKNHSNYFILLYVCFMFCMYF